MAMKCQTILMSAFLVMTPYVCWAEEGGPSPALVELQQQAEEGNAVAQYNLGRLYAAPAAPLVSDPPAPNLRPKYPFMQWVSEVHKLQPELDLAEISHAYVNRYGPPPKEELETYDDFTQK